MTYKMQRRAKNADTPENTARYYINNAKMLPEVIKSKERGAITDELAKMFLMLARKYAQRPCFIGYSFKEDMISEAIVNLCQNALKFNLEKSSNPFAYYTTCINSSFLQFLNIEKKHRRIRDKFLIDIGENPSFNFTEESRGEFKDELTELKNQISEAVERDKAEAEAAKNLIDNQDDEISQSELIDEHESELIPNLSLLDFGDETAN